MRALAAFPMRTILFNIGYFLICELISARRRCVLRLEIRYCAASAARLARSADPRANKRKAFGRQFIGFHRVATVVWKNLPRQVDKLTAVSGRFKKYEVLCIGRLQNDLYCVGWGVKHYSLTHYCALRVIVLMFLSELNKF